MIVTVKNKFMRKRVRCGNDVYIFDQSNDYTNYIPEKHYRHVRKDDKLIVIDDKDISKLRDMEIRINKENKELVLENSKLKSEKESLEKKLEEIMLENEKLNNVKRNEEIDKKLEENKVEVVEEKKEEVNKIEIPDATEAVVTVKKKTKKTTKKKKTKKEA